VAVAAVAVIRCMALAATVGRVLPPTARPALLQRAMAAAVAAAVRVLPLAAMAAMAQAA
jgi:hypothetical protein